MAKYIVDGTLKHDGVTYEHGAEFETEDEAVVKSLRDAGALKLPSELLPPEDLQAELDRLRAENAALKAAVPVVSAPPKSDDEGTASDQGE